MQWFFQKKDQGSKVGQIYYTSSKNSGKNCIHRHHYICEQEAWSDEEEDIVQVLRTANCMKTTAHQMNQNWKEYCLLLIQIHNV